MCRASETREFDHRTASLTRSPRYLASQGGLDDPSLLSADARTRSQIEGTTRPIPLTIQDLIRVFQSFDPCPSLTRPQS